MYSLNLSDDNRILSACVCIVDEETEQYIQEYQNVVDTLPEGDITDYKYIDGEYVYEPLPKEEIVTEPSQLDVLEAQVTYTAMMTDTLLEV